MAPYFATVALAGQLLAASGDEDAMARWLPRIADGSLTGALAVAEEFRVGDLAEVAATAEPAVAKAGPSPATKLYVIDGHTADLLLVVAHAPDGPGVFAIDPDAEGPSGTAGSSGPHPCPRRGYPGRGAGGPCRCRPVRCRLAVGGSGPDAGR